MWSPRAGVGAAGALTGALLLSGFTTCGSKTDDALSTVVPAAQTCPTGDVAALDALATAQTLDAGTPVSTGPALRPPKPTFTSRLLVPPSRPGESVADFSGCLSLAEATEASGARFPVPPPTEGAEAEKVRVNPMGPGMVIAHELDHACCLTGEVAARVLGTEVVVTERLTGTPCGCRCGSTVRSAVGLEPGDYTVVVQVEEGGETREVYRGSLKVTK